MEQYSKAETEEALNAFYSLISKCEKVKEKIPGGTSQHTLLIRRIKAFEMAVSLLEKLLEEQTKA